ncbi:MAG TPA: acyltransferase [Frankiaceae bacterium]|nr:acyltransferase [Frankiaceae bacterium]
MSGVRAALRRRTEGRPTLTRDPLDARSDPRQAKFFTMGSLRWVLRHRAYTLFYLVRYWRFFRWKARNPHIITEGFVFLGKNVELYARKGYGRLILGKWVHIGNGNALRAHEGTLRIGDKCVFGKDNTVNTYLDIEFGSATIVADWVYVCDFDHVFTNINLPIKDQGITKSPVRIGPDCWLGTKVTVLRGTTIGRGCVVAAHCLVNTDVPDFSVAVGVPVRVVRNRVDDARARARQDAIWAEEVRQKAARKAAAAEPSAPAVPAEPAAISDDDRKVAALAETDARLAGVTAPVDPGEQSDLPMAPGPATSETRTDRAEAPTPSTAAGHAAADNRDEKSSTDPNGNGAVQPTGSVPGRASSHP